jgi:hypothetical protein
VEPRGATGDASLTYYENTGDFELAIGQLILKFKSVENKGKGKLLRLSTARKLEEVSEIVNRWRQRLWHQRLGLSI